MRRSVSRGDIDLRVAAAARTFPTWNYIVVHAYGTLVVHDDPAWVGALTRRLTDQQPGRNPVGRPVGGRAPGSDSAHQVPEGRNVRRLPADQ